MQLGERRWTAMLWLLLIFIVVVIVFGLGFVVETLFWVALVLFILWLIILVVNALRGRGKP
jgi:hypothetical protein